MSPAVSPAIAPAKPELQREYVAGGGYDWYGPYRARSLPWAIDDLTSDFGDDLYERMVFDPQVSATLTVLKASILETGLQLAPAVEDDTADGRELAVEIADTLAVMLEDLPQALDDVLWDLLDALAYGNRVAEQVYEHREVAGKSMLALARLKVKNRRATAFVVDAYWNVLGLLAVLPGNFSPMLSSVLLDPAQQPNLFPREKFAILTNRPKNADPRGTSVLRPAYSPWWDKQQIKPEYLKYLAQFAGPSLAGFTPENAQSMPADDSLGNPTGAALVTPEQAMLTALLDFRNGTAAAFPFGAKVEPIEVQGEGDPFLKALAYHNLEIVRAILTQSLATGEGEHQARAAAQVHQDVLDTLIRQAKMSVVGMVQRDILRPLVLYNWGPAALPLVPRAQLGDTEGHDFAPVATAVAALERAGYLHPSQYPGVDEMLSLPARDPESITAAIERKNAPPPAPPPAGAPGNPQDPNPADNAPGSSSEGGAA